MFEHELSANPFSIIDEFGCLRKGSKCIIVRKLGTVEENPSNPITIIIDGSQLLYHIVWPVPGKGKLIDIVNGIKERITHFPKGAEKFSIFCRYKEINAKGHVCQRRAGAGSTHYNL